MSEVTISANKKLKTINDEFQENFPYLMLAFFPKQEWLKARRENGNIKPLDMNTYIRDIRTTKPEDGQELSMHGNTQVKNLENNVLDMFGIYMQVCYVDTDGTPCYTSGEMDDMALSALNKHLEGAGCQEYPTIHAGCDNSSVKTDQVTVVCRGLHKDMCSRLPALAPLAESKHYAKGDSVHSFREYYVDVDDEDIEAFFIEWDPEEEEIYMGFCVVPPDTERTAFKKKLTAFCEKQGIDTNEYGCFITYDNAQYETFLQIGDDFAEGNCNLFEAVKEIRRALA